ncbi:hypothetical protein H0H92_013148 [Tricholoma furcatifolium]|nr:hypothetical protein H0H92_013148 [Tricholoma furcatifolium]
MARLTMIPHDAICPNFASDDYVGARIGLISDTVNNNAAVALLKRSWKAANTAEKAIWDWQDAADKDAAEAAVRQEQALQQEEVERRRHETDAALAEERKKNRVKYVELSETPSPITPPEILPTYATSRLQKGQYIELWYFTNEGIASGLKHTSSVDENAMAQSIDKDGVVTWISAVSAKALHEAKSDRDLSWEQLLVASPRAVPAHDDELVFTDSSTLSQIHNQCTGSKGPASLPVRAEAVMASVHRHAH